MSSLSSLNVFIAIQNQDERSQIEDQLVVDRAGASTFKTAEELWKRFQERPVRFVITDRKFDAGFDGLELTRLIRKTPNIPSVYILMRSNLGQIQEIQEALDQGVDDYLVKPHNPFQIRSRVLVGIKRLG